MYALQDAAVRLTTLVSEVEPGGQRFRYLVDLKLLRDDLSSFPLTWTVIHEVTEDSPLALLRSSDQLTLAESGLRIMLSVTARDPSLSAQVYASTTYAAQDIALDMRYADTVTALSDEHAVADMRRLGAIEPELAQDPQTQHQTAAACVPADQ